MTKYQALRVSVRTCLNDANALKKKRAVISYTGKRFPNELVFVRHSGDNIQTSFLRRSTDVTSTHTQDTTHTKSVQNPG